MLTTVIAGSVVLLVVHVALQGMLATRELGVDWNAGPRDGGQRPSGSHAGRAERALRNYLETFPAFGMLAAALLAVGRTEGLALVGAWAWLGARVVYLPLYLFGVPYLRSLVWVASIIGLLVMAAALVV